MKNEKKAKVYEREISRLFAFIESKGGVAAVAKKIGKRPQFLYNIKDYRCFISAENIKLLMDAYPDFSSDWMFNGKSIEGPANMEVPLSEIEEENKSLKAEIKALQKELDLKGALLRAYAPEDERERISNFNMAVTLERLCDDAPFVAISKKVNLVNNGKMVA